MGVFLARVDQDIRVSINLSRRYFESEGFSISKELISQSLRLHRVREGIPSDLSSLDEISSTFEESGISMVYMAESAGRSAADK